MHSHLLPEAVQGEQYKATRLLYDDRQKWVISFKDMIIFNPLESDSLATE